MAINDLNDTRQPRPGDELRRDAPLDVELQADPELTEGPASTGRITIYAAAILVLLGAVFYGLNSGPTTTANTAPPATTADSRPAGPPVRDVTPNREPGTTTGAAPAQTVQPPQSNPTGTQVDQNKGSATR